MSAHKRGVIVVGASLVGLTVAESLRAGGYGGPIKLIGAESETPYDRPPLSKQVLIGEWPPERAELRSREALERQGIDLLLGRTAVGLDLLAKQVHTDTGTEHFDEVVIATGATPIWPLAHQTVGVRGVYALRTLADALSIRAAMPTAERIVVMGAGFLGTEVAAALSTAGSGSVTLVEAAPTPLFAQFGARVGTLVEAMHRERGVKLLCGRRVHEVTSSRNVLTGVSLDDGRKLAADMLILAVGVTPNTAWLKGSGVPLSNGVECDVRGQVAPGVYAAGDVANWRGQTGMLGQRGEHRTNATTQATIVAHAILGTQPPPAGPAYFWTDQYEVRFMAWGTWSRRSRVRAVSGEVESGRFVLEFVDPALNVISGYLSCGMAHEFRSLRGRVGVLADLDPATSNFDDEVARSPDQPRLVNTYHRTE